MASTPPVIVFATFLALLLMASCAGDDDDIKTKLAPFDGVIANFTAWLISFTAWVAWKKPELMELLNGTQSNPPDVADADAPTPIEKKRLKNLDVV